MKEKKKSVMKALYRRMDGSCNKVDSLANVDSAIWADDDYFVWRWRQGARRDECECDDRQAKKPKKVSRTPAFAPVWAGFHEAWSVRALRNLKPHGRLLKQRCPSAS